MEDLKKYPLDIPELVLLGIINYVELGAPVGGFLTAVLENDLHQAVGRADRFSMAALRSIMMVLYNEAPSPCWGSPEKVTAWRNLDADSRKTLVGNHSDWQHFVRAGDRTPLEVA